MNRRGFLKLLGGAAVLGTASAGVIAKTFGHSGIVHVWPEANDPAALRLAIERLFPAGVITGPARAYAAFDHKNREVEYDESPSAVRVNFVTFALGYYAEDDEDKRHRALYRAMYRSLERVAERPENRDAILVWRAPPSESRGREWGADADMVTLRLRAGLLQQGWRRRLFVSPWLGGHKPEGVAMRTL